MITQEDRLAAQVTMTPRQDSENNNKVGTEVTEKPDIVNNNTLTDTDTDTKASLEDSQNNNGTVIQASVTTKETTPASPLKSPEPPETPGTKTATKDEDDGMEELWAKLRCGSLSAEEVAERERKKAERQKNRQNRCADYPGFAFGSAMFGSETTMKFNIIKNELQNIMRSQLKRVEGEVNALSTRVKELDKNLEESEHYIRTATAALADAVALQVEESKNRSDEKENQENNLSAFDQHVLFLEAQLKEAKIKASHSFQILEDCYQTQESLFPNSSPPPAAPIPASSTSNFPSLESSSNLQPVDENLNSVTDTVNGNDVANEANNNIDNNNFIGNTTSDNNICLKTRMIAEDSANANVTV